VTAEPLPTPTDWMVSVTFYEQPDYQARVGSHTEATSLVHGWLKEGCVSKVERYPTPGRPLSMPPSQDELVDTIYPLSAVKQFQIRRVPQQVGPAAGPMVTVSGRLPTVP
jgi:hypothetical protein